MNSAHAPDLAHRLIRRAARKAPSALAERLEEEWLADLNARTDIAARLRLAAGCYWATAVITREFGVPHLASSGAGASGKHLIAELPFNLPLLSRRTVAFLVIAAIHGLIIYGFATGLAQHFAKTLPTQMIARFVDSPRETVHRAPPVIGSEHKFEPTHVDLGPVVLRNIEVKTGDEDTPDRIGTATDGDSQAKPALHVPVRAEGGPGTGFPATDDYYPTVSRRLSEAGVAVVKVCVDPKGKLSETPKVAKSSGSARLDGGALELARAGSGHYRPTTEDGRPVGSCFDYRIRFQLR